MKLLVTLFLLFCTTQIMAEDMLQESQYKNVAQNIGKGKPYFLEVGSDSCHSCQEMGKKLYKATQNHPKYNIYFINVKKEREVARSLKVMMIPTQIIYDKEGKEVYRHIGLLNDSELNEILQQYHF